MTDQQKPEPDPRWMNRAAVRRAVHWTNLWANLVWHSERMLVPVTRVKTVLIPVLDERTGEQIGERQTFHRIPVHTGEMRMVGGDYRMLTASAISGRQDFDRVHVTEDDFDPDVVQTSLKDKTSVSPMRGEGDIHPMLELKLTVERVIGKDHELTGLLLFLYPKWGPYQREIWDPELGHTRAPGIRDLRLPSVVRRVLEGYEGPNPDRAVRQEYSRIHRSFLLDLSEVVGNPSA